MGSEDWHHPPGCLSSPIHTAVFGSLLCLHGQSTFIYIISPGFLTHLLVGVALKPFTGSSVWVLSPQPTAPGRKGHIACLPLCLPRAVHGVNMLGMQGMPEGWMAQIQQPSLLAYKKAISSTIVNFTETWYRQCHHCHKPTNLFLKTLP